MPTASRAIELVAVRTAEVQPGPRLELRAGRPVRGCPARPSLELDGATCWLPAGWSGERDGDTWRLTRNVTRT